jgi:hypothetical protein
LFATTTDIAVLGMFKITMAPLVRSGLRKADTWLLGRYESSVGAAREAVKLVLDCISSPSNVVLPSKLC